MKKIVFIILLSFSFAVMSDISLPVIGQNSVYQIEKEKKIGLQFKQRLLHENKLLSNPLVDFYLNEILSILLQGLDENYRTYQVSVINDSSINAFAVPGGFIGVNYGLILAAQTEAQLAGVLSHEIAHIVLNHLMQRIEKQGELSNTLLASFFLALVLSQASDGENNGEAVEALILGGTASLQQSLINFTRENEYEADRQGLSLMKKSGYSAVGMAEFFSILAGQVAGGELANIEYLRTHPVSENRMGEAYQFGVKKSVNYILQDNEYDFFKIYLSHITDSNYLSPSDDESVKLFQRALKFKAKREYVKAVRDLTVLYSTDKGNIWVIYTLVGIKLQLSEHKEALHLLNKALGIYPENSLLQGIKINVLTDQKNYKAALKIALEELKSDKQNQQLKYKLIKIYEQLGLMNKARETEGDYHLANGNLERAKYLYQQLKKNTADASLKNILDEKIKKAVALIDNKSKNHN